jgi:lipopolysaccharide transport system ATP-binding protein
VAAYLEPEILVVDEVLAVGDVQFQKKCLGKMGEVARGGRTVLFVSHNMAAISTLTSRSIVLNQGAVAFDGVTRDAVRVYTESGNTKVIQDRDLGRGVHTRIREARLLNLAGEEIVNYVPGEALRLEVTFETDGSSRLSLEALLIDENRNKLALSSLHQFSALTLPTEVGVYRTILELAPIWPASGCYSFDITTSVVNATWDHYVEDLVTFDVTFSNPGGVAFDFKQSYGLGAFALPVVTMPIFQAVVPCSAGMH